MKISSLQVISADFVVGETRSRGGKKQISREYYLEYIAWISSSYGMIF